MVYVSSIGSNVHMYFSETKIKRYWSFTLVSKALFKLPKLFLYILKLNLWHNSEMISKMQHVFLRMRVPYLVPVCIYTPREDADGPLASGCSSVVAAHLSEHWQLKPLPRGLGSIQQLLFCH